MVVAENSRYTSPHSRSAEQSERSRVSLWVTASTRPRREQLRRLSTVFSVEIRLQIVVELYQRPMSPTEFFEQFGGTSVERVSKHFEFLEARGWLRRLGPKPRSKPRPGPDETLYRATELAFFDAETWPLLPYSLRLAYSWNGQKLIASHVRGGIERALRNGRSGCELTCVQLVLDGLGWSRVMAQLRSGFEAIFEEQLDAKFRAASGNGQLAPFGLLQFGFESPCNGNTPAFGLVEAPEPLVPFPERMAPVFADDLLMEVLNQLSKQEMGIKRFHREFASDVSEGAVRHRFKRLKELGWIAIVKRVKKRGTREHIYRATRPAVGGGPWDSVPPEIAETPAWREFMRMWDLVKAAIVAGTFDLRVDRHASWSLVHLDEPGRRNVCVAMEERAAHILDEQRQAKTRIEAGSEPLSMVVALAALESPISTDKAP